MIAATATKPSSMCFQGVSAAIKRLQSYVTKDGRHLELRSPMVRVRARGAEMVWRADTNDGPRWISFDGKWTVSKVQPKTPEEHRAA